MKKLSPLQFSDPHLYLQAVFDSRKRANSHFSYEVWARQLKLSDSSLLWRYVHGKRTLTGHLIHALTKNLELTPVETAYLQFLCLAKRSKIDLSGLLGLLKPSDLVEKPEARLNSDQFEFISQWYHAAILDMIALSDFQDDPEWISRRLGGQVEPATCQGALDRLIRLRLLTRTPSGKISRFSDSVVVFEPDAPNEPLRNYHAGTLRLGLRAVHRQNMQERHLRGGTLSIRRSDLTRLRAYIDEMHRKVAKLSRDEEAEDVYQISTQLFRLTSDAKVSSKEETTS